MPVPPSTLTWIAAFAVILVFFCVVFGPVYVIPFANHDDYSIFLTEPLGSCCLNHPQTSFGFLFGRPLGAILENIVSMPYRRVADLWMGRAWTTGAAAIGATLLAGLLVRAGLSLLPAVGIGAAIFLLPSIEVFVSFVHHNVYGLVPLILSSIAAHILFDLFRPDGTLAGTWTSIAARLGSAGLAMLAALLVYQATPPFLFSLAFAVLAFAPAAHWRRTRHFILSCFVTFGAVSVAYLLFTKFVMPPINANLYPQLLNNAVASSYAFALGFDLDAKLALARIAFVFAGSLWRAVPDSDYVYVVFALLACGGLACLIRVFRESGKLPIALAAEWLGWGIVLIGAANAHNLAASGGLVLWRTVFPFSAIMALAAIRAAMVLIPPGRFRAVAAAGTLLFIGALAQIQVTGWASNASKEFYFLKAELAAQASTPPKFVNAIKPIVNNSIDGQTIVADEFNMLSSNGGLWAMVFQAVRETYGKPDAVTIVNSIEAKAPLVLQAGVPTIDMRAVTGRAIAADPRPIVLVSTPLQDMGTLAISMLDGDPNTFFEAAVLPRRVHLKYSVPTAASHYWVHAGTMFDRHRMPGSWEIFGSNGGDNWVTIDRQRPTEPWAAGDKRRFDLPRPVTYTDYLIVLHPGTDPAVVRIADFFLRP